MVSVTDNSPAHHPAKARIIGYWAVTALVAFELVYGALWDFNVLNRGYVYTVLRHLGYPLYLAGILGACKLAAAAVIVTPGLPRLKEWAYAGVVILFAGAFVSHLSVGDAPGQSIWSLLFAVLTLASWRLQLPR
jgi:hypothetical protein